MKRKTNKKKSYYSEKTINSFVKPIIFIGIIIIMIILSWNLIMNKYGEPISESETTIVKQQTYPEQVCSNLDVIINETTGEIFYTVADAMRNFQSGGNILYNVSGDMAKPLMFDDDGVMCKIPSMICDAGYTYCTDLYIIVPVNYTEYEDWRSNFISGEVTVEWGQN